MARPAGSGDRGDPRRRLRRRLSDRARRDVRYVAPDARLSILEIKWGLVPDMGGIALMRELARGDVVRELAFTGRQFSGAEAAAYGFATAVHTDPLAAARSTARESRRRAPARSAR